METLHLAREAVWRDGGGIGDLLLRLRDAGGKRAIVAVQDAFSASADDPFPVRATPRIAEAIRCASTTP